MWRLQQLCLLYSTDVVSYAATGNGITKHVHVFLENNSDKKELKENGKGKYIYEGEDKKYELEMNEDEMEKEGINADIIHIKVQLI